MKYAQTITLAILLSVNFYWIPIAHAAASLVSVRTGGLYTKDSQGFLWGVNNANRGAQNVVKFSGKRDQLKPTVYSGSFLPTLKAKDSNLAHNAEGYVDNIWPLPNGMVLFVAEIAGKNYLYKLNPKTNTVGNNKPSTNKIGYSNKQAVMNIGQRKSIHHKDIRTLHQRSLLIATYKNQPPVLFFGEYNVNYTARIDGKPGDEVALWKSTDLGDTWSKVITWNTKGHQTDHIHGLRQNPYNGWIYILTGDKNKESGIIAWDGKSSPPPDNTTIANMGKYKGWKSITNSENVRTGDIVFTKNKCIWIPDVDFVGKNDNPNNNLHLHSQQANHDLSHLQVRGTLPYKNHISPILAHMDTNGTIYWASLRSKSSAEQKLHLWTSRNFGA
uniref:hypothetical protein n=1 Tax=Crenothrix polyspora TaxID=360316 RepID=UPI001C4FF05D